MSDPKTKHSDRPAQPSPDESVDQVQTDLFGNRIPEQTSLRFSDPPSQTDREARSDERGTAARTAPAREPRA